MSSIPAAEDVLDFAEPVLDLPAVAELLAVPVTRVHQQLRDGHLIAVRRNGIPVVPEVFINRESGEIVKPLPGLLGVLRDGGVQVVLEHAVGRLGQPAAATVLRAARCAHPPRAGSSEASRGAANGSVFPTATREC